MVISWRFNYVFSLLPSVIKETILKKRLWDGSLEEGQGQQGFGDQEKDGGGWEQAECSGAEPPGLSLPTQEGPIWDSASWWGREMT